MITSADNHTPVYWEHTPVAPLCACIEKLWCAQGTPAAHSRQRVLPTGNVQVILNLARDYLLDCMDDGSDQRVSSALVVGARAAYEVIDETDLADLVGVVFRPGGFAAFIRGPVDQCSHRNVALEDLWGANARQLRDRLMELSHPKTRLLFIESFLLQRFTTSIAEPNRQRAAIGFAIDQFNRSAQQVGVREIAQATGWSERRFSQVFREVVGLPPKTWFRVQRFRRAVRRLHTGSEIRSAELALDCGYYDQSHFSNEFRAFSGMNPTSYASRRTQWSNHVTIN